MVLVQPTEYSDQTALQYYQTSTNYLLQALGTEGRDVMTCATTAVILNVYEVMSQKYKERMTHLAGARDLIRECGWNARSTGVGAACFWLNIGMELLSCLAQNIPVAWDPDQWGTDLSFDNPASNQYDEVWTHRMVYILAKICNFRADPASAELNPASREEQMRRHTRMQQWQNLKDLIDSWDHHAPRTMHPVGYVEYFNTKTGSRFPEVWLIKRTAIMARLLYHTGMVLLAQLNPMAPRKQSAEMRQMELDNAITICGIVVHNKDR